MRRALIAFLVSVVALVGLPTTAQAEPGEDGAHPDPPGYYDPAPIAGWMTERAGDRVHDFAQIGNTVYVAGTFSGIRPGPGGPITYQANLAAFDATTGAHLGAFDPVVNGSVYSLAVAPDGSRLYAGGSFTSVDGGVHKRLAALHPVTGEPVLGFDADVSGGSVRSVVARGGDLYISGNFASVAGVWRTKLARLSATTGVVDPAWDPVADGGSVLTLEIPNDGSRVYIGGRFDSVDGTPATADLAALSPTDGAVDPTFTAQPDREVFDLLATDDGRLYVAEGGGLGRAEAFDNAGTVLARWDTYGDVQAVEEIGDHIFFGGHDFGPDSLGQVAVVDPDDLAVFDVDLFAPVPAGGDHVWAFHATGGELWLGGQGIGSNHGFARHAPVAPPPPRVDLVPAGAGWTYLDDGSDQGTAWRQTGFDDSAWGTGPGQLGFGDGDEATLLQMGAVTYWFRHQFGVGDASALSGGELSMLVDDGAVVYLNGTELARHNMPGGTVTASTPASTAAWGAAESAYTTFAVPDGALVDGTNTLAVEVHQVWAGSSDVSFDARLSGIGSVGQPPDTTPPTVPGGLQASDLTETSFTLSWSASTDDVAVDHYEVFRDGVSAGQVGATFGWLALLAPGTTYQMTVEAVDAAGNRSGLSAPLSVTTLAGAGPVTYIAPGSTWSYLDDGGWATGSAELGFSDGDETTVMASGQVTYWFRSGFSVVSAAAVSDLTIDLLADDGAVVYVNGIEVVRDNMPAGPIGPDTAASSYRWGAAEASFSSFAIPTWMLVDGANTIAVEVHQAPGSRDLSFDLGLDGVE